MMSATGKVGVKRKCSFKTVDFKYQAILEVEKGSRSKSAIAKELGVSNSTLSTWLSNKDTIKKGFVEYGPKRKTTRVGKWDELEQALLAWFKQARDQGAIVSGAILMQKADEFAAKLEINDFEAKSGWLTRFKDRNGISFKSICGEAKSVDLNSDSVSEWNAKLRILLEQYSPDHIYNADETGVFYKMLPDKTLEFKNVDCNGGKRSKDRLTVMVCANMSGTDKLPLLVIGKAAKPRCFKGIKTLPTKYTSNTKAWMTSDIFVKWLKEVDCQMIRKKRKIAMIVDNCPAHPKVDLENVELIFLPPNTTSKLQPMDQGVINNLKVHYRKRIVLRQIRCIDNKETFTLNVLHGLRYLQQAWQCVRPETISNCFKHAGFVLSDDTSVESDPIDDDEDELDDVPLSKLTVVGNKVVLSDFIQFDDPAPTSGLKSDDDIISDLKPTCPDVTITNDDDDDDDEEDDPVYESVTVKLRKAMEGLDSVRNFLECLENSENEQFMLGEITKRVLREKVRSIDNMRQSTMTEFTCGGRLEI